MEEMTVHIIARIHTDFASKFGVPRQSGLAPSLRGEIVFEPEFRNGDALRGIEDFSHLWLVWQFSEAMGRKWQPTVRPPRLGGNRSMGVFATRSPYRPNPIGLSCVRLEGVEQRSGKGTVLIVSGADLMDGTPILDIKPYLPYADCQPTATGGFTDAVERKTLDVVLPEDMAAKLGEEKTQALREVLAQDPRPAYQNDAERVYGMTFGGWNVRFTVEENCAIVQEITESK